MSAKCEHEFIFVIPHSLTGLTKFEISREIKMHISHFSESPIIVGKAEKYQVKIAELTGSASKLIDIENQILKSHSVKTTLNNCLAFRLDKS